MKKTRLFSAKFHFFLGVLKKNRLFSSDFNKIWFFSENFRKHSTFFRKFWFFSKNFQKNCRAAKIFWHLYRTGAKRRNFLGYYMVGYRKTDRTQKFSPSSAGGNQRISQHWGITPLYGQPWLKSVTSLSTGHILINWAPHQQ